MQHPTARLSVPAEVERVATLPGLAARSTNRVVVEVALAGDATVLAAGSREATELAVLVDRVDDPVDPRVVTDHTVVGVNKNHFVELVCRVLHAK